MPAKTMMYMALSLIAPVGVVFILYGLAVSQTLLAWVATVIVLLAMKGRVQFGDRVKHGPLFWIHLSSSIVFLGLVSAAAFMLHSSGFDLGSLAFFMIPLSTGAVLWWQGVKAHMVRAKGEVQVGEPQ